MGYMARVQFPAGALMGFFSLHCICTDWGLPNLLSCGHWRL